MKKVKANKEVYIRTGSAYQKNGNKKGLLYPGFEIEVTEELEGQDIDGNKKWYKDKNGDYYWSGGFEGAALGKKTIEKQEADKFNIIKTNDLRKLFETDTTNFSNEACTNINIALVDSGVDFSHSDLMMNQYGAIDFYDDDPIDNYGHGTHLSGIISSKLKSLKLIGLAPEAKILNCKITNNGIIERQLLLKSLKFINDNNTSIDIVNLSLNIDLNFSLVEDEKYYNEELNPILKELHDKGIIVIAAAGNDFILSRNGILIPGYSDYTLGVGAIEKDSLSIYKSKGFHENVDFVFLNKKIESTLSKKNTIQEGSLYGSQGDCSVYTAVVSGIVANYLSHSSIEKKKRLNQVRDYLNKISGNIKITNKLELYKIYKT